MTDLRLMQELVSRDGDASSWHVGDLAWAVREERQHALSLFVTLFIDGDRLAGWTWVRGRGLIDIVVAAARRGAELYDAMLEQAEAVVDAVAGAGDSVAAVRVWAPDDDPMLGGALGGRGYAHTDAALQLNRRDSLDEIPEPRVLPPGWTHGAVDSDARIDSRVECHRAAFAPSILTHEGYRRSQSVWPYREELDRVLLTDSGEVVAACTTWLDEARGSGLLEPVATLPREQGRGYGRAVCIDGLRALRDAGARSAQVACVAGSPACATYRAIGFEPAGRISSWTRTRT